MFACALEQNPLEELAVKEEPTYKEYLVRILKTTERGYQELHYQDVQSSVEPVHRRGDYLEKRRIFNVKSIHIFLVTIFRISRTRFILRGVEL